MTNQIKIEETPASKIDPLRFEDGRPLIAGLAAAFPIEFSSVNIRYGEKFDPRTRVGDIEVWIPIQSKRSE